MEILFQNENYVAVHKPSGLLVHPSRQAAGVSESCMGQLRDQLGRWVYPIHRLDRAASGVLLFGLSSESANEAASAFREKRVRKTYYALVRGWVPEQGVIEKPLRKKEGGVALPAVSEFVCVARAELPFASSRHSTSRYSLARVTTQTGRLHQIRRHLVSIAHPIIGDTVYGEGRHNRYFRENYASCRLLLMAQELEIPSLFKIMAPWPGEILDLFAKLGWDYRDFLLGSVGIGFLLDLTYFVNSCVML